jgi:hypothetical protein
MEFSFSNKAKSFTFLLMAIGAISLVVGFLTDGSDHHNRWWSAVYINALFFTFITFGALFFNVLQYATEAAWSVMVKRIFESIVFFMPYGVIIVLLVHLVGSFHGHHIFHWMDPEVHNPESIHYDAIIANKGAYLNIPFFWVRSLVYVGTFMFFAYTFRKRSLQEDKNPELATHFKNYKRAGLFLVFFAVFSSTISWDWVMSIDTHWFSTLFGWYLFSGMWCTAMIVGLVMVLYLKAKGYLPEVNNSHIHDVGKWMFALSFLWSYLWFSQFMLIWYSNIPEEVTYFVTRIEYYKVPFFTMFFVNFALPMVVLMSRDAKRNPKFLITIATLIFLGHWVDVWLLVTPGVMGGDVHLGLMDIGMFLGFLGLFVFVVLKALTKAPLVPVNHPYLDESVHHNI